MTGALLSYWLQRFGSHTGRFPGRSVVHLLDNCSGHGNKDSLAQLSRASVLFILSDTRCRLQPPDARIIPKMKTWYRLRLMKHSIDLVNIGESEIHRVVISTCMKWFNFVWKEISFDIVLNCWNKSGALNRCHGEERNSESVHCDKKQKIIERIGSLIRQVVLEYRRNPFVRS